jgi:hypothetical protein
MTPNRLPSPHPVLLLAPLMLASSGCAAVEGIFKAGVWVGVVGVLLVVALIIWAIKAVLT